MDPVTLSQQTTAAVDILLGLWEKETVSESAQTLVARSVIDALLDVRSLASEFSEINAEAQTTA